MMFKKCPYTCPHPNTKDSVIFRSSGSTYLWGWAIPYTCDMCHRCVTPVWRPESLTQRLCTLHNKLLAHIRVKMGLYILYLRPHIIENKIYIVEMWQWAYCLPNSGLKIASNRTCWHCIQSVWWNSKSCIICHALQLLLNRFLKPPHIASNKGSWCTFLGIRKGISKFWSVGIVEYRKQCNFAPYTKLTQGHVSEFYSFQASCLSQHIELAGIASDQFGGIAKVVLFFMLYNFYCTDF
jgi:hypothetical protein